MIRNKSFASNFSNPSVWIGIITAVLFTYAAIRAFTIEFSIDEIFSRDYFAGHFTVYPDSYDGWSANHHWLNSWLMWAFSHLFGDSPFILRLPNVLAYLSYLFFSAQLALLLRRDGIAILVFILLNVHPYLLDFFSLARGYGLALGFLMPSIYYVIRFAGNPHSLKYLLYSLGAASLSVLSGFTLLCFFISLVALFLLMVIIQKTPLWKKQVISVFLVTAILFAFVLPHIFRMQKAHSLFYGTSSLWEGTVKSLCEGLLYNVSYEGDNPFCSSKLSLWITGVFLLTGLIILIRREGIKKFIVSPAGISFFLFGGTLAVLVVQHLVLKTLYPEHRTALFLFVLFLVTFCTTLHSLFQKNNYRAILFALPAAPVILHFILCMNISFMMEWREVNGVKDALCLLKQEHNKNPQKKITLTSTTVSVVTFIYLHDREKLNWLEVEPIWDTTPPPPADFHFVEKGMPRDPDKWIRVAYYSRSGNELFKEPAVISTGTNSSPNRSGGKTRRADHR